MAYTKITILSGDLGIRKHKVTAAKQGYIHVHTDAQQLTCSTARESTLTIASK